MIIIPGNLSLKCLMFSMIIMIASFRRSIFTLIIIIVLKLL